MQQFSKEKLKNLLVVPGFISEDNFKHAEKISTQKQIALTDVLIEQNFIKDEELGRLIAQDKGWRFINLRQEKISEKIYNQVPEIVARNKGIIVFGREGETIKCGMVNPNDLETIHILEKRFNAKIKPFFVTKRDFNKSLAIYRPSLKEEIDNILYKLRLPSIEKEEKDKFFIKITDLILHSGSYNRASDIHLEPEGDKLNIRFRIDGVMHRVLTIPKEIADKIISRIKILSHLRIDEHYQTQDGKFSFNVEGDDIDVRVSIVPVTGGENFVLRLLSARARQMSLDSLGISKSELEKIKKSLKYPQGMILSVGPTGSGKTTTLYEIIKILNTDKVHIASIEDPVEYDIAGVSQIQVNPKINLSFAQGLRAIVRQDPDIIMVGEIRDRETAEIAINAAMTGHLVLSTLHANDAATTLPRLLDIGIEPYLLASTINVIIAQRLVRTICEKCRYSYEITEEEKSLINSRGHLKDIITNKYKKNLDKLRFYKGAGCKICNGTGYGSRIGVFEILELNSKIKDLIIKKSASEEILVAAKEGGMKEMMEDGVNKVLNGETSLLEILRVIG